MNSITFASHDNFLAFQDMAEALWTNYRDDNAQPQLGICEQLLDEVNKSWAQAIDKATLADEPHYPLTVPLSSTVLDMALAVVENCVEFTQSGEDPGDEPVIRSFELSIHVTE